MSSAKFKHGFIMRSDHSHLQYILQSSLWMLLSMTQKELMLDVSLLLAQSRLSGARGKGVSCSQAAGGKGGKQGKGGGGGGAVGR